MARGFDWAGYSFIPLGHHDGHFFRGPGVYIFVRRLPNEERIALYVGESDCVATVACPGGPAWTDALLLGMNELHVFLKPCKRIDRLLIRGCVIKRCSPLLNLIAEDAPPPPAARDVA